MRTKDEGGASTTGYLILSIIFILILLSGQAEAKEWTIQVYYITQNNQFSPSYASDANAILGEANTILKNYDGTTLKWQITKIDVPSAISVPNDINEMNWNQKTEVFKYIPNFQSVYTQTDVSVVVFANQIGGANSYDYKSPIYYAGEEFKPKSVDYPGGMGFVHEFLHPFGLKDVNGGQKGCIGGDVYITTLNLCDQSGIFKQENYQKTPLSELGFSVSPTVTATPTQTTNTVPQTNKISINLCDILIYPLPDGVTGYKIAKGTIIIRPATDYYASMDDAIFLAQHTSECLGQSPTQYYPTPVEVITTPPPIGVPVVTTYPPQTQTTPTQTTNPVKAHGTPIYNDEMYFLNNSNILIIILFTLAGYVVYKLKGNIRGGRK